jgi:hypothetical protein
VYESRHAPLLPRQLYLRRVIRHAAVGLGLGVLSLGIGMAGYAYYEHLEWRDAFMNAAMLLGGMGPVHNPQTPGGKVFAGLYALYAGLVFLVTVGIVLVPVVHRLIHRFHLQEEKPQGKKR